MVGVCMKVENFINRCVDEGYSWKKGLHKGIDGYFVGSKKFDTVAHFPPEAIEKNSWGKLVKEIIQGKDVYHVTRIVGYFSRVHNWNSSKIGELKDRQKGRYRI